MKSRKVFGGSPPGSTSGIGEKMLFVVAGRELLSAELDHTRSIVLAMAQV